MTDMLETKKYTFTVEGETERWYLLWLRDRINEQEGKEYKVAIEPKVQQHPMKFAKGVNAISTPEVIQTLDCWGRFTQKGMKAAAFSPALCVGRQCSPTLLIHGEADTTVSPEHSTRYYAAMQDAGIPCDLLFLKDTTHAFLLAEYYKDTLACETAIDWILKMTLVED